MRYRYSQLKEELGIVNSPFLSIFERYCHDMRSNTRVLEWSCKISGDQFEGARFLHTARVQAFFEAQPAVNRMLASVVPAPDPRAMAQNPFLRLQQLAEKIGEGVALGYAEEQAPSHRRRLLKLYVSTSRVQAATPFIESIVPDGAAPPEGTHKVMIAASKDEQQVCQWRAYYLWRRAELDDSSFSGWINEWCTSEEIQFIRGASSKTISVSFKGRRRDMIYLSAPFDHEGVNYMILRHIYGYPIAYNQLDNLRWVGFSKWSEGLRPRELNMYFTSDFS